MRRHQFAWSGALTAAAAFALLQGDPAFGVGHDPSQHQTQAAPGTSHPHPAGDDSTDSTPKPAHGCVLAEGAGHDFEVFFHEDSIQVFPRGQVLTPDAIAALNGRAFFLMPGATAYSEPYPLTAGVGPDGEPDGSLGIGLDLGKLPAEGVRVNFQVWKMPDAEQPIAEFIVPFSLSTGTTITVAKATAEDKMLIAAQAVCPVTGDDLNAMGTPLKVTRGDDSAFLCCQGCVQEVEADPEKFFDETLTYTRPAESDAAAIAAQKTCPISGEPLDAMGSPIKASLGDRSVFLCCAKDLREAPEKFFGAAPAGISPSAQPHDHDHDH